MRCTGGGLSESEFEAESEPPLAKLNPGLAHTAASATKWKSFLKVNRGYMPQLAQQIQQIP
jgi:hypothetical protein